MAQRTIGHTVTTDPAKAEVGTHAVVPARADTFDFRIVPGGGSFRHTFDVPGRYVYFCVPHEMQGMIGEGIVE